MSRRVPAFMLFLLLLALTAHAQKAVYPGRQWQVATPESQGLDAQRLGDAVAYLRANSGPDGVDQLVIVRNGYLVHAGPKVDSVHGVWSCTKSFVSTCLGLLVDSGRVTLDTPAWRHAPVLRAAYSDVTLRHFATMTSGYSALGDEPRPDGYRHGPSETPFTPGVPRFTPGTKFEYWDSAMNQFARVLTAAAGEPLRDLFRRRIAEPIGMAPDSWHWGDFGPIDGVPVNSGAGNYHMMEISAREMARFGLLFLNRGRWNGRQLLSAAWVDQATRPQLPEGLTVEKPYGFNWWPFGLTPDRRQAYPGVPPGTYAASGYNNNDLFVIPEWNMVVVRLGLDQRQFPITDEIYATFLRKLGEAMGR